MITSDNVESFKSFLDAGGLVSPSNLIKGQELKPLAEKMKSLLMGLTDNEIEDYQEASDLVLNIAHLLDEMTLTNVYILSWNTYLESLSVSELERLSIASKIKCLVDGVEDNAPIAAILPMTSKEEITALENAMNAVDNVIFLLPQLMAKVNEELTPLPTGGGSVTPPAPPPELTPETIKEVKQINDAIIPLLGSVLDCSEMIDSMITTAITEKNEALVLFSQAINFTLSSGQRKKPSVAPAIEEMTPKND